MKCWSASAISALQKKYSGGKCQTFTQPAWIMTQVWMLRFYFFKTVQNKMHWAAHGQTAAEKIYFSADSYKPNMGLYSFSGNHPTQSDSWVVKNYCNQDELEALNGIVSAYLEFAEMQARRHIHMYMNDFHTSKARYNRR